MGVERGIGQAKDSEHRTRAEKAFRMCPQVEVVTKRLSVAGIETMAGQFMSSLKSKVRRADTVYLRNERNSDRVVRKSLILRRISAGASSRDAQRLDFGHGKSRIL